MRILVTGADGFVGRHLVRHLHQAGHAVHAAVGPGGTPPATWDDPAVTCSPLDLDDRDSIHRFVAEGGQAVIHLAALSSGLESRRDPGRAWEVNAAGTARLCEALAEAAKGGRFQGAVLIVSSAEVYGMGQPRARRETDAPRPCSPYAASKLGAETAALEVWRRAGLQVLVARPFPHTGPGQRPVFALPAFVERLAQAKRSGSTEVITGDLSVVRDYVDVRDVVRAYAALLEHGTPGEVYNIARGAGVPLADLFHRLSVLVGVEARPTTDPALLRSGDIPHLVGDAAKLTRATGWSPTIPLVQTLSDLVHAQAH